MFAVLAAAALITVEIHLDDLSLSRRFLEHWFGARGIPRGFRAVAVILVENPEFLVHWDEVGVTFSRLRVFQLLVVPNLTCHPLLCLCSLVLGRSGFLLQFSMDKIVNVVVICSYLVDECMAID